MSKDSCGAIKRLSPGRCLAHELMHHARKVPTLPLSRTIWIPDLIKLRGALQPAPSWMAIFLKAYGLTAKAFPELRRVYLSFPYARLYEHPHTSCLLLQERDWQGQTATLAATLHAPEKMPLAEIDTILQGLRRDPIDKISAASPLLRMARLPGLVRRLAFWSLLSCSGARRASRLGTCAVSSLGSLGVEQEHPRTPVTTHFTFGPIAPDGAVTTRIVHDDRVMDGQTAARALIAVEETLKTTLVRELTQLKRPQLKLAFSDDQASEDREPDEIRAWREWLPAGMEELEE